MIEWWEWLLIELRIPGGSPRDPDDRRFVLIAVIVAALVGGFVLYAVKGQG
jgi:hypothetical protein